MFLIAYTFKGQVHVFAGQVKIVTHSSCRTNAKNCNFELFLSPVQYTHSKGKSVFLCSFSAVDLNVTCRHLGFVYGNFTYHSFTRNETNYMLFEKPACTGSENSLFDCPGSKNIKYGASVCSKFLLISLPF